MFFLFCLLVLIGHFTARCSTSSRTFAKTTYEETVWLRENRTRLFKADPHWKTNHVSPGCWRGLIFPWYHSEFGLNKWKSHRLISVFVLNVSSIWVAGSTRFTNKTLLFTGKFPLSTNNIRPKMSRELPMVAQHNIKDSHFIDSRTPPSWVQVATCSIAANWIWYSKEI